MFVEFSVRPIGRVSKDSGNTVIEVFPAFREGLMGLDGFSHVLVFYWFDKNDTPEKRATMKVHPRGDPDLPLTGVFATRSPARPNLIGLAACRIKAVQEDRIVVEDFDAFEGTPVIDLKPYIPANDSVPSASVPEWVGKRKDS